MRNFVVLGIGAASLATGIACFTGCGGGDGGGGETPTADGGTFGADASSSGSTGTDGGSSGEVPAATYTVYANVVGLQGTGLVLHDKSGADVTVTAGAATQKVAVLTKVKAGTSYEVTVKTQPSGPPQSCAVTGGSGSVVSGDVESITVNCTTLYTVGGTVSGLDGKDLILENNGAADSVTINANGQFAFPKPLASGAGYAVTVKQNPTAKWQTCAVVADAGAAASGTVGTANITNIAIKCTTNTYDLAVKVTGLAGAGLVFQNNGGDDLAFAADGTKTFATKVASGAGYDVVASTQPTSPWQTCTVAAGKANMAGANVTLNATCTTNSYKVGGTLSGLQGNGLVLQDNAGDDLTLNAAQNGAFFFATKVASGMPYAVTVKTQPNGVAGENCFVAAGAGTVAGADVTSVNVTCTTRTKVMVCGTSGRDVNTFLPANSGLTVQSNTCTPDASTQAFIVTRGGQNSFDGPTLKAWVEAGGIVLTEYYSTDNVWNAVFGTNQTEVMPRFGSCTDIAPSVVQFTANDPVWAAIPFQTIALNQSGCGQDVSGYQGIVPLSGWTNTAVSIGYRDAGQGRVYATDFDWQDGQAGSFAFTNTLMGYFITHRR